MPRRNKGIREGRRDWSTWRTRFCRHRNRLRFKPALLRRLCKCCCFNMSFHVLMRFSGFVSWVALYFNANSGANRRESTRRCRSYIRIKSQKIKRSRLCTGRPVEKPKPPHLSEGMRMEGPRTSFTSMFVCLEWFWKEKDQEVYILAGFQLDPMHFVLLRLSSLASSSGRPNSSSPAINFNFNMVWRVLVGMC